MRQIRAWILRLAGLFARNRRDRELTEEIQSHLQMQIDDNLRRGLPAAEARRAAFIKAGSRIRKGALPGPARYPGD